MSDSTGLVPPDLLQVIGREFIDSAPKGWVTGTATFARVGNTSELRVLAFDARGTVIGGRPTRPMSRAFNTLREMLTQPGKGAFLTATYRLRASDGEMTVDFDYDHEPTFDAPIDPGHYAEELEQHPRASDAIPDWWHKRIAQGKQSDDT